MNKNEGKANIERKEERKMKTDEKGLKKME